MENLKRARRPLRSMITKSCNELEQEIAAEVPDKHVLKVKLHCIEETLQKLDVADQKIVDQMIEDNSSDQELETEFQTSQEYKIKVGLVKEKVEALVYTSKSNSSSGRSSQFGSAASAIDHRTGRRKTFKLPKIELKKFSGDLKEWLGFWSQFEKIHTDSELHASDKFQYLIQSMVPNSRAYDLVISYPQSADNYAKVIQALKDRFGKQSLLVEVYVRELLRLVQVNLVSKEKISLAKLYDQLESHLMALESIGLTTSTYAAMLYPMVESCLSEEILRTWQRSFLNNSSQDNTDKTLLQNLMEFLKLEVETEERIILAQTSFNQVTISKSNNRDHFKKSFNKSKDADLPTAAGLFAGNISCIFCDKPHASESCCKAVDMSFKAKQDKMKEKNACFSCLRPGHSSKKCKSYIKCPVCYKKHYSIVCPQLSNNNDKPAPKKDFKKQAQKEVMEEETHSKLSCSNEVILQTLIINAKNQVTGSIKKIRALCDPGSQRSYILNSTVEELRLKPDSEVHLRHLLFGGSEDQRTHHKFRLQVGNVNGKFYKTLEILDHPHICTDLPRMEKGKWMEELKENKIFVADLGKGSSKIEMLIGSDYYGQLLTGNKYQLKNGLTAIETHLGWTLSGRNNRSNSNSDLAMTVISMFASDASIKQLWDLETLGIKDPVESKSEEEKAEVTRLHFLKTVTRNTDGRYSVRLPWNDGEVNLPSNSKIAERRLELATQKLISNNQYQVYEDILNSWLSEDIIEEVDVNRDDNNKNYHYLPHRAVFKPESKTTPVRPVFDASCKTGRNPSLNDCLLKGPNLLDLIPSILLKFREGRLGVTSDIRKAFPMVEINEQDRDFLRFFWWENYDKKTLKVYRHRRVVFGVTCSPFLLGAVLEYHLTNVEVSDKNIALKLLKSLYVDNCVTSVDSIDEYEEFMKRCTELLADAQMELRQWEVSSGEESGVGLLGSSECGLETGSSEFSENCTQVLGLKWDRKEDSLSCVFHSRELPMKITKRFILSITSTIFDPIGFLCPVLLVPKLLLQESWEQKINWDVELPEQIKSRFLTWYEGAQSIQGIKIPRNFNSGVSSQETFELHTFCDASKYAYATVIFLRVRKESEFKVQLLQAKSRIAPIKKVTIPRLELLACTIGARLTHTVKEVLSYQHIPTFYWTDSSTALAWIKSNDQWGTFVGNRVKEICRLTNPSLWYHVPGIHNPADLPSRGCKVTEMKQSKWWEGPDWLRMEKEYWPNENLIIDQNLVDCERRKTKTTTMTTVTKDVDIWYMKKFSSFQKNVRLMAWILRFINKLCNKSTETGDLTFEEVEAAKNKLFFLVQTAAFSEFKGQICGIRVIKNSSGLFCVKTKLIYKKDTDQFRLPIVLPSHPLVSQLIQHEHIMNNHAGIQFMMSYLRENYWILKSRRTIKSVISKCVVCRRYSSKKMMTDPAALPADRVKEAKPFEVTGVDLAGPLYLKGGSKVWIVLFTCAVYRCVHLELVESISTDSFLFALSRFISRRGRPTVVYSDNGTNFIGTVNVFKELDWNRIEKECQLKQIKWKFNPPSAAWWGGWWERLIRIVKDLLKRTLGHKKLVKEQLETCVVEIEAVVNGRPLTFISEDDTDLIPLTPAAFLQEITTTKCPEAESLTADGLRRKYRDLKQIKFELNCRFRKEYLSQLVQRGESKSPTPFKIGDIVLVGDDNKKRQDWTMARILELISGKDDVVRVARVKTSIGNLLRPVQRLYPLEVSSSDITAPKLEKKAVRKTKPSPAIGDQWTNSFKELTTRAGRNVKVPVTYPK